MNWLIIIIIVSIVISVINAATKKKAAAERARRQREAGETVPQPPRPSTMSDIQKAFMTMTGEEPPVNRTQPSADIYAGSAGQREDMSISGVPEGVSTVEGTTGRTEGTSSLEGRATEGFEFHAAGSHSISNKYTGIDLDSFSSRLIEEEEVHLPGTVNTGRSPLRLFESKDDYTKAVIYSEILTRRTGRKAF